MTDEVIYQSASIGERVDLLKLRIERLERASGQTHYEGDKCAGGHFNPERDGVDRSVKYKAVSVGAVARWERIEAAARQTLHDYGNCKCSRCSVLSEALKP